MVALIKVIRWKCPECTEVWDTEYTNERPLHQHFRRLNYETGEVEVEQIPMQKLEEYWS